MPIAVVVIVLILRAPIAGLIPRIRQISHRDWKVDLVEQLKDVEEKVAAEVSEAEPPASNAVPQALSQLALDAPRAAILFAWGEVEAAIERLMVRASVVFSAKGIEPRMKMRSLKDRQIVDDLTYETFVQLYKIRNDAAHLSDRHIDYDEAVSMSALCKWLVARLDALPKQDAHPQVNERLDIG